MLYIPAPPYLSGEYDSSRCIPKPAEELLYKNRFNAPDYMVTQRVKYATGKDDKNVENLSEAELQKWVDKKISEKQVDILSPVRMAHYDQDAGFFFRCDYGYNLKFKGSGLFSKAGEPTKVLYTLCPPADLYTKDNKAMKKSSYFTLKTSWKSPHGYPKYEGEKQTIFMNQKHVSIE